MDGKVVYCMAFDGLILEGVRGHYAYDIVIRPYKHIHKSKIIGAGPRGISYGFEVWCHEWREPKYFAGGENVKTLADEMNIVLDNTKDVDVAHYIKRKVEDHKEPLGDKETKNLSRLLSGQRIVQGKRRIA